MTKVRLRSPLDRLPLHVKQQLAAWLTTGGQHGHGITYAEARTKLRSEFGISAGVSALCRYFQRHATPAQTVAIGDPVPAADAAVRIQTFRNAQENTLTVQIKINLAEISRL